MYLLHQKSIIDCINDEDKLTHQKELGKIHEKINELGDLGCMFITLDDEIESPIEYSHLYKILDIINLTDTKCDFVYFNDVFGMIKYDDNHPTKIIILPFTTQEDGNKVMLHFSTSYDRIKEEYGN